MFPFGSALERAKSYHAPSLGSLIELCSAVVSETLISGTLTSVPKDLSVVSAVRESLADHAVDERTHHAYFTRVLETIWPQLQPGIRNQLGTHFADFILAFLSPDMCGQQMMLGAVGFTSVESEEIARDSNPHNQIIADVRHASRSTIALLERVGVLADKRTKQYFIECGLLS